MMIHVTRIGDLAFEVRLDAKLRHDLHDVSGWGTEEEAVRNILAGVLLGDEPRAQYLDDLDDDDPF